MYTAVKYAKDVLVSTYNMSLRICSHSNRHLIGTEVLFTCENCLGTVVGLGHVPVSQINRFEILIMKTTRIFLVDGRAAILLAKSFA